MTQVIVDGGSRLQEDAYTGLVGELREDRSNGDLRLHDGVTPGGKILLSRDNADRRYQAKSPELDGLLGFEPQQRGILVRRGPADYRLRSFLSNDSIKVTYGDGYAGNPDVALAPIVNTDHRFAGTITFSKQIKANGGLAGDVTGNLTGNVTGNVTGDVTGHLQGSGDGDFRGTFDGDVDTSDGTLILGDGQVHLPALNADVTNYIQAAGVPKGFIGIWYGTLNNVPAGWFLCDGNNGTPNLTERMVVCASGNADLPVGATGGSATHIHVVDGGAHDHVGTSGGHTLTVAEMPSHAHGNGVQDDLIFATRFPYGNIPIEPVSGRPIQDSKDGVNSIQGLTQEIGGNQAHTHPVDIEDSGPHEHTVAPASSMPPFYVLAYIMKGL